jgi:hypothetical protein
MIQLTEQFPAPTLPPEVMAFAAEQSVSIYLQEVLAMTQQIFQRAVENVSLADDPEIADDRHIVFEVDVAGMDESQLFAAQTRWSRELFEHCPPAYAPVFRYALVAA